MPDINSFLTSSQFTGIFFTVKLVFIIVSFIMLAATIVLLFKANWFKDKYATGYTEFLTYRPYGVKKEFKTWTRVIKKIETGKEADCKMAVVEADDLLKEVFQKMGYSGDLLDDVLEKVNPKILPSIDRVGEAHKIRNNIVRNPDYNLTVEQARNIIRIYQKALSELEMF